MKKYFITLLALVATATCASADIQAPPASEYTPTRKLGRALSNIVYGVNEIPEQMSRSTRDVNSGGILQGLVSGTSNTFRRMGYGFYELFTFRCPTFHGTFKQPYMRCGVDDRQEMNPSVGLSEYPPELGFESYHYHVRTTGY